MPGLTPLWPSGRTEEGDLDGMFASQYGAARVVAILPRFRTFITRSDVSNMLEWGIQEDDKGNLVLSIIDPLSRDNEINFRKRNFGDILNAHTAAYLHPGSALISLAVSLYLLSICFDVDLKD